mgnify:CR=1 FL=1
MSVAALLIAARVPFAVVGGSALGASTDLDLEVDDIETAIAAAKLAPRENQPAPRADVEIRRCVECDLLRHANDAFRASVFARARDGVASVEDVLLIKHCAATFSSTAQAKYRDGVEEIVGNTPALDFDYINHWCERLGLPCI